MAGLGSDSESAQDHLTRFNEGFRPCSLVPLSASAGAETASCCGLLVMALATAVPTSGSPSCLCTLVCVFAEVGSTVRLMTYICIKFSELVLYSHDLDIRKHRELTVCLDLSWKSTWASWLCVAFHTHLAGISHRSSTRGCYHPLHPLISRSTLTQRPFRIRT